MKIAVVAANGRVAQKVVKEAQERGFDVTAYAREDENKSGAATYIKKDILDLTKEDLAGFDAVVDGFGAWEED
ncbi:MAG: NAD(P)H-binding protein, partial [Lachnospiraceae bacterium]|nr:NAD(P)H-binding protein [Lachnospiraceae bacterium]